MYSYCHVCSVLGILFHFVVLCTVCVKLCTVLLPPGVNATAVNRHITTNAQLSFCVSGTDCTTIYKM